MSWKFVIPVHLMRSELEELAVHQEKAFSGSLLNTTVCVALKFDDHHILSLQFRYSAGYGTGVNQWQCCDQCGHNNDQRGYGRGTNYAAINCGDCGEPLGVPHDTAHQMMLIDNVGFIIGKTAVASQVASTSTTNYPQRGVASQVAATVSYHQVYKDQAMSQKLSRAALMKHVPVGLPDVTLYVVVTSMADIPCDQAFAVRSIIEPSCLRPYGTALNLDIKVASKKFLLQGSAQVEVDGAHINSLTKKSEYFAKLMQRYCTENGNLQLDDVDAAAFEMLVEVNHHGKEVYMNTDLDRTLAQCCRDLLVVANQLLCHEVAEICAQCIVQSTAKDTVFADILLLASHYNGERKLEVISSLGEKIRDLKPGNKAEQLRVICETFPHVAVSLIDKLT